MPKLGHTALGLWNFAIPSTIRGVPPISPKIGGGVQPKLDSSQNAILLW
jgi:hypothetical protein